MRVAAMFGTIRRAGWSRAGWSRAGQTGALVACLAAGGTLQAQFSGPAVAAAPSTNQRPAPTTDASILIPGLRDPIINPGDQLTVRIFGTLDYSPPVRVGVDGNIQLPLIGVVPVGGLTVDRAEDLVARRLTSAGMYVNPQVTIQVSESAAESATVSGEMHAIVPLSGDRRLLDVLAAAGSLPERASHTITILRNGQPDPIVVNLGPDPATSAEADIQILPGDKILISKVGVVYVLGAFKTQGAIPLIQNSPLTLMQATALSGGAGFEGRYKDLRIIRTKGLTRTVVKLDIKKVLDGQIPDPVLEADDIVFLPSDNMKAAIKSGGLNTVTGLASLLVIALER